MSWREAIMLHRVKRNGAEIAATGDITTTEDITALTITANLAPAARPALVANDALTVEWIDIGAGITRYQFVGTIADVDTESDPQATAIPARGPLAKLEFARKAADGDKLLTGMTDQEVVSYVLTYCGISHDPDDIHGSGYVLGVLADPDDEDDSANLWWRVDEPGSKIIGELDEVFAFKTFEVANARIVRRAYTLAPTGTGLYRTYTKGTSRDLWSAHRRVGKPDAVQNAWNVTGPTIKCGPGGACQCTVWAKARDTNPQTGSRRRRRPSQDFQSDLIQDTGLATSVARRFMRWYNRFSDEFSIGALNDVNVHPTSVIRLVDSTPLIDCGSGCYGTVTSVERTGSEMAVTAVTGEAGDEGTITSGVEVICNDVERSGDSSGDGVDPDPGFPPIDIGDGFDPGDLDGWGEGGGPDLDHPFSDCTGATSLTCPESPDICHEAGTSPSCAGTPPVDVCAVAGWHPDNYPVSGIAYDCMCEISTNLVRTSTGNDHHFYVDGSGTVQKIGVCQDEGDSVETGVSFYLGNTVSYLNTDISETFADAVHYGLSGCIEFDFKFCTPGERINVSFPGYDGGGTESGFAHVFTLYGTPGGINFDYGGVNPRSTNSNVSGAELSGDAPPHHAYGNSNRNSGGVDLGPGLPLNTDLHAVFCVEVDGDNPRLFWNNGLSSGYHQPLSYFNEETPLPGEPTSNPESAGHTYHLVKFGLTPGEDRSCLKDCPGPQVWGILTGSETCAPNEDFVWPEGETG